MLNNIKYITRTATLLALSAFMSCAEMEDPQTGAIGYLAAPSLAVDVTVHDISLTKAAPALNAVDMPSADAVRAEVKYVVRKKGNEDDLLDGKPWTEALTLPTGETYVVEAFYGDNEFDGPCLYGSQEITIAALETAQPNLNVKVSNSLLCVSTDPLDGHFTMTELVMTSGNSTRTLTKSESVQVEDTWIWVPAGQNLELEIKGTNSVEAAASFTHSFTPQAGYAYNLISGKPEENWPSISLSIDSDDVWASRIYITTPASFSGNISAENQAAVVYEAVPASSSDWNAPVTAFSENGVYVIKGLTTGTEYQVRARVGALVSPVVKVTPQIDGLSATAMHTSTAGELDGTDVISAFAKSDAVREDIESWSVDICKADGTVLRSSSSLGTSDGSAITSSTGWPYLPVGNGEKYVITASATMDGQTYFFEDLALEVPPTPDFSLVLSAYTSYDKYAATNGIAKDLNGDTGANKCDASTLYNAGGKWGISVNIMSNENYAKKLVIDFDGDDSRTYPLTSGANEFYEDITGCSWDSHQLSVSLTFDNKTVTKTQTHHITGLPYTVSFYGITSAPTGWTTIGLVSWEGYKLNAGDGAKYLRLRGEDSYSARGKALSPEFHIPGNIDVSTVLDCCHYESYGGATRKVYVNPNNSNCVELTTNANDVGWSSNFDNFNSVADLTNQITLSTSQPHISISHNVTKDGSTGAGAARFIGLKSFSVAYR